MSFIFAACEKFDSSDGSAWSRYIEWSGFDHLDEIVSIDSLLCPSAIASLVDDDWAFNLHADNRIFFFHNCDYLKRRINYDSLRHNLLTLTEQPTETILPPDGFSFCGYDILDSHDSISVLTNCGTFPSIYTAADINRLGLVDDLDSVTMIANQICNTHPDDDHCCDCRVWGIARYRF